MKFKLSNPYFLIIFFLTFINLIPQEEMFDALSLDSLLNIKISSASKYLETTMEAPASVTIITSEDIERFGYRTFDELFKTLRGFYISYDRNYLYLGSRGFSRPTDYNNRILLLIDGHTMNEFFYGSSSLGTDFGMSLSAIDRVEIVRGPGSSVYGTSAMFSVINVVTKKGKKFENFQVEGQAETNRKFKASFYYGTEFFNKSDLFISGFYANSKGGDLYFQEYANDTTNFGIAKELDWDKYFGIQSNFTWENFEIHSIFNSREKGIPTASYTTKFNDPNSKTLDKRSYIELKFQKDLSIDKIFMCRAFYDNYYYKGLYPYEQLNYDKTTNNWLGTEIQFIWDITSNNRLLSGIEYKNILKGDYEIGTHDSTTYYSDFPFTIFSFYLQDEFQLLENLSFTFGVRNDAYSNLKGYFAPRGSVIFNPDKRSAIKLIFGSAFRVPNLYEINYEDINTNFKKSSNLKPEKIFTTELIYEHKLSDEIFGIISIYNNEIKDLIDTQLDLNDSLYHFMNINNVSSKGFELELNYLSQKGIKGYLRFSTQKSFNVATDKSLSNSPTNLIKLGFSFPLINMINLSSEFIYETKRITVYDTETNPFLLTNMNIYTKQVLDRFRFSFLITNLFNITYKYPGGIEHIQSAITQDGRKYNLKLTVEL